MNSKSKPSSNGHAPTETKIGVIGAGVVGGALLSYFRDRGLPVVAYDKFKPLATLQQLNEASIVFICVPTPYKEGHGLDYLAIEESMAILASPKTVVIKSTVLPGTSAKLANAFPQHHVMFNPEFLREKTALEDFLHPDRQIVGVTRDGDYELARNLLELLPPAPYEAILAASACEMIKVATNSFLALKVTFANEIYDLCTRLGVDYVEVKQALYADARIGASHFDVFDGGYRGYGGKCLPKDSLALLDLGRTLGMPLELLLAAQAINARLLTVVESVSEAA